MGLALILGNGDKYEGEFKNGKYNGQGTLLCKWTNMQVNTKIIKNMDQALILMQMETSTKVNIKMIK